MKPKLLLLCGIVFFILGNSTQEHLLFYFFSFYVFLLFVALFFQRRETRQNTKNDVEPLPEAESSDLQSSDAY